MLVLQATITGVKGPEYEATVLACDGSPCESVKAEIAI